MSLLKSKVSKLKNEKIPMLQLLLFWMFFFFLTLEFAESELPTVSCFAGYDDARLYETFKDARKVALCFCWENPGRHFRQFL